MPRRLVILGALAAATLMALAVSVGVVLRGGDTARAALPLRADPYPAPIAAPDTRGRGADGRPLQVPAPGRPAVVTFLFADCPTVCPLVATQVAAALDRVPPGERDDVDVVAISVDPRGDTPANVRRFLATHRLTGRMRYLVGTRAELEPVWRAWGILAQPPGGDPSSSLHTARVVLVDRAGRQVADYPGGVPVPPDDLAADIGTLVREG
ncbi:MAG TPA: SCO family protein [Miltoncostaeaceae bacterium]|nr:SCO family protein [Miltoncostaeaceae bacterium]